MNALLRPPYTRIPLILAYTKRPTQTDTEKTEIDPLTLILTLSHAHTPIPD
jgi:hypothetical protein